MKTMNKKMLAGIIAGAVLVAGGFGGYTAQAAQAETENAQVKMGHPGHRGHHPMPQMNKETAAAKMADTFSVSKDEVLAALQANRDFREVGQAAMLAKISGKSFSEVIAMKNEANHWQDVEKELGVTREQVKAEMDNLMASRIAKHGNVELDTAKKLLADGYQAMDIEMAGILAKESGKDIQAVLDKKKINNRWEDVANSLGVDSKVLHKNRFPGNPPDGFGPGHGPGFGGHHGPHHGNPPMGAPADE